ncbi:unnamed protein product [Rotaria sordida]|uniref:Uncharacterized protein n=1 Tax=Rotaria sordida TaxID=392033 RepID=A0A815L1Q3_9BILA|nr:unnamed protein product [Rotaria sordida]CAF1625284.1 unnamed protein product [Rotaria sordida]
MDKNILRSRQKVASKSDDKTSDQEKEKMLIKNRKQTAENYDFGDIQKVPSNIENIMEKNFLRIFIWELYFEYIFWTSFFAIGPMSTVGKLIISLLSFQLEGPLLRLLILSCGTCAIMIDLCTSLN